MKEISISKCRSILEEDGEKYTDEEIVAIRGFLMTWAKLNVEHFLKE